MIPGSVNLPHSEIPRALDLTRLLLPPHPEIHLIPNQSHLKLAISVFHMLLVPQNSALSRPAFTDFHSSIPPVSHKCPKNKAKAFFTKSVPQREKIAYSMHNLYLSVKH